MNARACAAAALLALVPSAASASDDPQQWTTLAATAKLGDRLRLQQEVTFRFSDARNGLYEIESNTLVGYRIAKRATAWAGYTHDVQYVARHSAMLEHRAREQITWDNVAHLLGGNVSARLRAEQRWREGSAGTGWRLRPYVRFALPLHRAGRTSLVVSHESFIDLNTTGFQRIAGEERMRNAIAIAMKLDRGITAEFGYLDQHSFVRGGPDKDDHVASIALSLSL